MPVTTVDRTLLADLRTREERRFEETHPRSLELSSAPAVAPRRRADALDDGVGGRASPSSSRGPGARFTDVDGHEYVDLCLGDTGAMTGHAPEAAVEAIAEQVRRGITLMLPTEDAIWVGEEMARRFGLPYWQFALTATDANRFTIRLARRGDRPAEDPRLQLVLPRHPSTRRSSSSRRRHRVPRRATSGRRSTRPHDPGGRVQRPRRARARRSRTGRRVRARSSRRSPTSASSLPDPGYHDAVRELTRRHGTFLVIDETHTICAGPGGYTRRVRPRSRLPRRRQAARAAASRRLRTGCQRDVAARSPALRPAPSRRRRHRRHAGRQRALAGGHARHPRARPHRRGVRAHDPAGRAVHRRRRGRDRRHGARLAHHPARLPGRVWFQPERPRTGGEAAAARTTTSTGTCTSTR